MKILIDLGHPAHIHYFKNIMRIMQQRGHEFSLVARDKDVLHALLTYYQTPYVSRGKGKKTLLGKYFNIFYADYVIGTTAKNFTPDIFLSFASPYAAHVSRLFRKPHVALDDTEHAKFEAVLYAPFTDVIINPSSFWKKFPRKQILIDSFMELCYLHPNYFTADSSVPVRYGIACDKPFFVVRFVSWDASHDLSQSGIPYELKLRTVELLKAYGTVIISSESPLPRSLENDRVKIHPAHLHDLLTHASLYVGEGATTASECVVLGTPAIYINSLNAGTLQEQSDRYGLISLRTPEKVLEILERILPRMEAVKEEARRNRQALLSRKIDCTAFLVWFVENYPESRNVMRTNPEYQYRFR